MHGRANPSADRHHPETQKVLGRVLSGEEIRPVHEPELRRHGHDPDRERPHVGRHPAQEVADVRQQLRVRHPDPRRHEGQQHVARREVEDEADYQAADACQEGPRGDYEPPVEGD